MTLPGSNEYYLQVVKDGETPQWGHPEEELTVGSQPLSSGYTQYWAYPKNSNKEADDLPPAEVLARENPASKPAVIIDQVSEDETLRLVLVKDGHAWAKTESSLSNLEDNITALLDSAKANLGISTEHFMTTSRVSESVERKLDELEEAGGGEAERPGVIADEFSSQIPRSGTNSNSAPLAARYPVSSPPASSNKLSLIIPALVILAVFAGVVVFKDKILAKLTPAATKEVSTTPTPTLTPTLIPTPSLDRSQYKIRVLNGTKKTGAAGVLGDELKGLGWEILSVGNAVKQSESQTLVRVKPDLDKVAETLISDLAEDYQATVSSNLKTSDKADAEVVIGKE